MQNAFQAKIVIPGFNIPYPPMMQPVVMALQETNTFGLIMVARLEWIKFKAGGLEVIYNEYHRVKDEKVTRLHLDHVPVIDEDNQRTDFEDIIGCALEMGYESVMVDGSRLPLEENITCTKKIVRMAHKRGVPVEAELGAVLGHEEGPLPPYEELYKTGQGFTSPDEARQFIERTDADWLSVAIGNIHGAVSASRKDEKKTEARLNIEHLKRISELVNRPLVLHGGTGIRREYFLESFKNGISKINIGTAIRQPYERNAGKSVEAGQSAVYQTMLKIIRQDLQIEGSAEKIIGVKPSSI
jgi:ketose-bisphosphate aldolase